MNEYIIRTTNMPEHIREAISTWYEIDSEIVRCRDCRHFTPKGTHKFENGKTNADYCKYVRGWMLQIDPDGFCAWASRRDGEPRKERPEPRKAAPDWDTEVLNA